MRPNFSLFPKNPEYKMWKEQKIIKYNWRAFVFFFTLLVLIGPLLNALFGIKIPLFVPLIGCNVCQWIATITHFVNPPPIYPLAIAYKRILLSVVSIFFSAVIFLMVFDTDKIMPQVLELDVSQMGPALTLVTHRLDR